MLAKLVFGTMAAASVVVTAAYAQGVPTAPAMRQTSVGRIAVSTVPFPDDLIIRDATYTPTGKVLVSYISKGKNDPRDVNLAVIDDDGTNMRTIFSQVLPQREKDNGIRYMVFADNKRIALGDFIVECAPSIDVCTQSKLLPVVFPPEVASGDHVSHRWSEIVIASDNRHIAWTTLLSNYSALVFLGELRKEGNAYNVVNSRIISTPNPFTKDPAHADGVLPQPVRGGEVKQFVDGGRALSFVGASRRNMPASVVQDLASGKVDQVTDTPGYTETTIFSPDNRLGLTMTTRFSQRTDPAILGLMPLPYPASLDMKLSMFAYMYAVAGVRVTREGNIGPELINIRASKSRSDYEGVNLSLEPDWVFHSPMSWHPGGKKGMWIEGQRGTDDLRIRVVQLLDYRPAAAVKGAVPTTIPYASSDLSAVPAYGRASQGLSAKVYGRRSGYLTYRSDTKGVIEKTYFNFSDDAKATYSGSERMEMNPGGRSTYTAKVTLSGAQPGVMDLKITFGPLGGKLPSQIIFASDEAGAPLTRGYVEYAGQRLNVKTLVP